MTQTDYFCFDIETIPNFGMPSECIPEFDESTVKLGNLKDEAKIKAKLDAARVEFELGKVKKMSVDPALCRVCTVGFSDSDEALQLEPLEDKDDLDLGEYLVVKTAWTTITTKYMTRTRLVSYNGILFDLPVLWARARALDVPVDRSMYKALTQRYSHKHHCDLMQELAEWDRQRWKPLDFWLLSYGLGSKSGDGSQVYEFWKQGKHEEIRTYCEQDVKLTAALFERTKSWLLEQA